MPPVTSKIIQLGEVRLEEEEAKKGPQETLLPISSKTRMCDRLVLPTRRAPRTVFQNLDCLLSVFR